MTPYHGRIHIPSGLSLLKQRLAARPYRRQASLMLGQHGRVIVRRQSGPRRYRTTVILSLLCMSLLIGFGALALGRVPPARPGPEVIREVEKVKEVEKVVVVKERRIPPILRKIAACESNNSHYDRRGNVLRGKANRHDVGKYQINTALWGTVAARQGYDLYDEQGNEQMALYLLHHYGSMPWRHSAACWVRK